MVARKILNRLQVIATRTACFRIGAPECARGEVSGKVRDVLGGSERRFRALVAEALDSLPEEWARLLDNVAVVVEDGPSEADLLALGMEPDEGGELLGLYHGIPLHERGVDYSGLPDRILIYRGPILSICSSRQDVVREIRETVLHELGHHFGLSEEDLPF